MQTLFFFFLFLPRSLPLLRLIEETVESTVAAAEGAAALYIRPRLQVGAVSFGQPGHHLIKKTDRGLIITFGFWKCLKSGRVTLVWALGQSNVCCLFLIKKKRYAIIIQHVWVFFSFFWGGETSQTHKIWPFSTNLKCGFSLNKQIYFTFVCTVENARTRRLKYYTVLSVLSVSVYIKKQLKRPPREAISTPWELCSV